VPKANVQFDNIPPSVIVQAIEAENQISQLKNKVANLETNLGKLENQITIKNEPWRYFYEPLKI